MVPEHLQYGLRKWIDMTMLERAARALWATGLTKDPKWPPWESAQEHVQDAFCVGALATIRAIRNPDKRVLEAMAEREANDAGCRAECTAGAMITGGCPCAAHALVIWQAGIDAMLEERG